MALLRPQTVNEVVDAVRAAGAASRPLEILGSGTRRGIGHRVHAEDALSLEGLAAIVDHDAPELVVTVQPGARTADVIAHLATSGQRLAFEPPDLAPLWGGASGTGTIGGLVAAGIAGPRRLAAGGGRDHVLGVQAVNGLGEVFVAGGKVLKNVTGYDLPKVMAGSWGTLAILTEISLKALPMPAATGSLVITGLDPAAAVMMMTRALQGAVPITGAAHLPGHLARTLLRLEGTPRVLSVQRAALAASLEWEADWLDDAESQRLWQDIAAVGPFVTDADAMLWRIILPATQAPAALARLGAADGHLLDWGGALIWLWHAADAVIDVRAALAATSGHAMLMRAPAAIKAMVPVFPPLPPPLEALQARVRTSLDPAGLFNPGRLKG
ncbi:2-hydroxy-acid oxidase [Polymorphobacter multimanifer]|uniref:glycolate oxidase subunit GlcE n=1 Tax=Polymorphobacter multimanifer TaxID=1070431 RepID=UPI00166BD6EA|nr:glycolate oxidase subunit GlcE [Polymorphobacter multimanifer]GGI75990.1 2-hydroxy-acid oxidase [Polymorphobacter multimanifer]